ncbi:MAG: NUDIX domain-containing protein [Acidimicrobiales bacterium]
MRSLDTLRAQIGAIDPINERASRSIAATLDRLEWPGDPFSEEEDPRHLTASVFVISSRGVVLHRHRVLGIWIQPGGHVEASESPESAALRETLEETGLIARHLDPVELFQVDVHPGPKGHTHYDLRYVVVAPPLDPTPPANESPEVEWFDFDAAAERCEPALVPVLATLARSYATWNVRE